MGWYKAAIAYYQTALTKEIATEDEKEAIEEKIALCKKNIKPLRSAIPLPLLGE